MLLKGSLRVINAVYRILSILYLSQNTQCLELQREQSKSIIENHRYVTNKEHKGTIGMTALNKRLLTLVKAFTCVDVYGTGG